MIYNCTVIYSDTPDSPLLNEFKLRGVIISDMIHEFRQSFPYAHVVKITIVKDEDGFGFKDNTDVVYG